MSATTTTDLPLSVDPPAENGSEDRLAVAASKLRTKRSLPADRWFQLAGAVFMGLGILAIIGGWYGVSHTARAWRQTPYLVSGGLLGLALTFIGGFAYFAYWMTRLVEQGNRQIEVLERMERLMFERAEEPAPSPRRRRPPA